jgi:5-methylcytosine-specific restriction endonuclease McrA
MGAPKDPVKYEEWLRKIKESLKGKNSKPCPEATKRKISVAKIGKPGKPCSEEKKRRLRESNLGKHRKFREPFSKEHRRRISEALVGHPTSKEAIERIRLTHLARNGGQYTGPRQDPRYFVWKEAVHSRDQNRCLDCGMLREEHRLNHGHDIHAHHIDKSPELFYEVTNGQTLCTTCHRKEHDRRKKK